MFDSSNGRRAIVTGGAGFVGSQLMRHLLDAGWSALAYDLLKPGRRDFLPDGAELVVGDILDETLFAKTLAERRPDVVFHLAAIHYVPYCDMHPQEAMRVNVVGSEAVFRQCLLARIPRVVFASTAAVYPARTDRLTEDVIPAAPLDIYGFTKLFGEQLAHWMHGLGETEFVIARLFNAYGPRETSPHLIPALLKQLIDGLNELEVGNIEPKRDYVFVEDLARGLYGLATAVLEKGRAAHCANVCSGREYSVREVIDGLQRVTGRRLAMSQDRERMRASDRPNLLGDPERLRRYIGWAPDTDFYDGLTRLVTWAKANPQLMVG